MKAYVFTVIVVAVISGIVTALLPADDKSVKKQITYVTGLICAFALLSPVVTIAKSASAISQNVEGFVDILNVNEKISQSNKIIIESGREQISNGVKEALISKYNFKEENVTVQVAVNEENVEAVLLEGITVTLKKEATWTDSSKIQQYVEGLVGCPVKIIKS